MPTTPKPYTPQQVLNNLRTILDELARHPDTRHADAAAREGPGYVMGRCLDILHRGIADPPSNSVNKVNPVTPLPLPVRACLHQDMTPPRIKIESKDTVVIDRLVNDAHSEEIVRRLNHHDALVNALQRIQSLGYGPDQGSAGWQAETAHTIATEALNHL